MNVVLVLVAVVLVKLNAGQCNVIRFDGRRAGIMLSEAGQFCVDRVAELLGLYELAVVLVVGHSDADLLLVAVVIVVVHVESVRNCLAILIDSVHWRRDGDIGCELTGMTPGSDQYDNW